MTWRTRVKDVLAMHLLPAASNDAVLLTFDDGPHPDGTPAVLDALDRHGARGVFFIVGARVARAPHLLKEIVDRGHVLANHSFEHPLGRQFGLRACRRDLERCQTLIETLTGRRPRLFRPPLGHLSPASLIAPRLSGLTPVLWSLDSGDWRLRKDDEVPPAATRFLAHMEGRRLREIALFHDERVLTARLLDLVLPELAARAVDLRPAWNGGSWYQPTTRRAGPPS